MMFRDAVIRTRAGRFDLMIDLPGPVVTVIAHTPHDDACDDAFDWVTPWGIARLDASRSGVVDLVSWEPVRAAVGAGDAVARVVHALSGGRIPRCASCMQRRVWLNRYARIPKRAHA